MMTDEDIQEYHNIGKAIKHNNKYTYITGTQITDQETGTRVYDINSSRLPSVTTILGATKNKQFLKDWTAKVGEKRAEEIKNLSSRRGTAMHKFLEHHILGTGYDDLTELGQTAKAMAKKLLNMASRQLKSITDRKSRCITLGYMLGLLTWFATIMV